MAKATAKTATGAKSAVGALPPHWLDSVIERAIRSGDASTIARAIANSTKFMAAVRRGLKNKPVPGVMSGSHAQNIREEVRMAIAES